MTTSTNLTRRAALAGTAALPALALAMPAAAESDDPAVRAFHVWRDAWTAHEAYCNQPGGWPDDDPEGDRLHDAEWTARKALAETVATSPAGIACQLRFAFDLFADLSSGAGPDDLDGYEFNGWGDDLQGKTLRNLLAAAETLAGRTVA